MKQRRTLDQVGLRLSRQALRLLRDRGILAQPGVSLEHHLAKRYVVRGLESGSAVGDLGRSVTFAKPDGRPIECLDPVDAIGVNGLHAVVVAPALVRTEMLREGRTYDLLITQHQAGVRLTESARGSKQRSSSVAFMVGWNWTCRTRTRAAWKKQAPPVPLRGFLDVIDEKLPFIRQKAEFR